MRRLAATLLATVAAGTISHAHRAPRRRLVDRFDLTLRAHGHQRRRRSGYKVRGFSGVVRNGHRP